MKEPPHIPQKYILPADTSNISRQEIFDLYEDLFISYKFFVTALDDASEKVHSIETLYANEYNLRAFYQEKYEHLYGLHRRLPPGCFKLPHYRDPEEKN